MSETIYRMYWRKRSDHNAEGEGMHVSKEDKAYKICQLHNQLYPEYEHYFVKEIKQQQPQ